MSTDSLNRVTVSYLKGTRWRVIVGRTLREHGAQRPPAGIASGRLVSCKAAQRRQILPSAVKDCLVTSSVVGLSGHKKIPCRQPARDSA